MVAENYKIILIEGVTNGWSQKFSDPGSLNGHTGNMTAWCCSGFNLSSVASLKMVHTLADLLCNLKIV